MKTDFLKEYFYIIKIVAFVIIPALIPVSSVMVVAYFSSSSILPLLAFGATLPIAVMVTVRVLERWA